MPRKNLVFAAYCDEELCGSHGAMAAVLNPPAAASSTWTARQIRSGSVHPAGRWWLTGTMYRKPWTVRKKRLWHCRLPWRKSKSLEKTIDEKLAPFGIKGDGFFPYTRFFHYGFCEPDCRDIADMLDACREATGKELQVCGSCLSDLSVILKYGRANAFGFGCGRNFDEPGGAHQPNEFIECDKLVEYTKNIGA